MTLAQRQQEDQASDHDQQLHGRICVMDMKPCCKYLEVMP